MIVLNEYESAVFLARDKCRHKDRRNIMELLLFTMVDDVTIVNGKEIKCQRPIKNPKYNPYVEGELDRIRTEENEIIYEYLKERYPNEDYAEKFEKYNINKGVTK